MEEWIKKFITIKKGGKHFLELCLKGVFGMAASKKSTPKSSQTKKRPSGSNKTETKQGKRTTTSTSQTKKHNYIRYYHYETFIAR